MHCSYIFPISLILCLSVVSTTVELSAQCTAITGRVFTDFNENGTYEAATEAGLDGIVVEAYNNDNTLINSAVTAYDGTYSINTSGATAVLCPDGTSCYRIEFTLPPVYSAWAADANGGGEVQRVCDAACTADLAAYRTGDYCEDAPKLTTTCFLQGANNGAGDVLISFPFNTPIKDSVTVEALENQIATTYGLAYSTAANTVFAGAFEKRFSGYGSGTTGTIYRVDNPKDGTTSGTPFLDLNTLYGGNVAGTDQHNFTDTVSSGEVIDGASFNLVGRQSLGDVELSEDELTLYTINLANRSLYAIPLGSDPYNPVAPTTTATIDVYDLASTTAPLPGLPAGVSNNELRPMALKYFEDKLYIGMVTNGETNGLANMYGLVYEFDPVAETFAKKLEFPLNYARGCGFGSTTECFGDANWIPWLNANTIATAKYVEFNEIANPQPMFGDLDFDVRGNMIISLRDRFGDQGAFDSPLPQAAPNSTGTNYHYDAFGDILKATTTDKLTWSLNISDFTDNTLSLAAAANGQNESACPDGENVFQEDCYNASGYIHEETTYSGITLHYPSNQVASIAMDPDYQAYSTGVEWFDATATTRNNGFKILAGQTAGGEFAKGNGLGDLELICAPAPVEIGNYVWFDTDADGIQDPCEAPIPGLRVELFDATDTKIGEATTDANGHYYFGGVGNLGMSGSNKLAYRTN